MNEEQNEPTSSPSQEQNDEPSSAPPQEEENPTPDPPPPSDINYNDEIKSDYPFPRPIA
jgi:hypothetical protein